MPANNVTTTLLLDLDDTLLATNPDEFLPAYYDALADHLSVTVPPSELKAALFLGVRAMRANRDPRRTLQEVFESEFYGRIETAKAELQASIADFYSQVFPTLRKVTQTREGARQLVEWAKDHGLTIGLATDPLFPRPATLERIRWAGLQPEDFDLISTFETFHFTKDRPAFFAEFMGRLGWPEGLTIMGGNDLERDLEPAQTIGLATFHVEAEHLRANSAAEHAAQRLTPLGHGTLTALRSLLEEGPPAESPSTIKDRQGILALLEAAPAALQGITMGIGPSTWAIEPSSEDWALVELVCHLRDTEREVHQQQIVALLEEPVPFVPRPDAAVWAKQRKYLNENGPNAVGQFAAARMETLAILQDLPDETWSKAGRHAIFGPTTFGEVLRFMADHDRMHLQQAAKTLALLSTPAHRKS